MKKLYTMKRTLFTLASLCATVSALAATTQAETVANDSSRVYDLDEVSIVSHPKDVYRLRLQPVSSTMIGQHEMQLLGIGDLRAASQYVPGFAMPDYGSRYTSSIYVRGIGSRVNSPAMGIYVDNVPLINKSSFNAHVYQTDRIDVLRGPQGTLYGQNTEGGLLRLTSVDPFRRQGTDIKLSAGTGFTREVEVSTNQRVSDKVGVSFALFYDGQNGFFRNQTTGERADRSNELGGKLRLLWRPTERWQLSLATDGQWADQTAFPYGLLNPETGQADDPAANRMGSYKRLMWNTSLGARYQGQGFDLNNTLSWQYLNDDMLMDIDYMAADNMHMQQAQLGHALTEELTLKSRNDSRWHWTFGAFFAYEWLRTDAPVCFDADFNAAISQSIHDAAYYPMLNAMAQRMVPTMGQQGAMEWARQMIERSGGVNIDFRMSDVPGLFRTPQANLGLFHESNIDITDRLTATLGLRYDLSHVKIDYDTRARAAIDMSVMGVGVKASAQSVLQHSESDSYNQLLPKVGLTYRIDSRGSNVYATVAKGYRAGGFNIQMFSDILQKEVDDPRLKQTRKDMELTVAHDDRSYDNIRQTISYRPEESWNYELGTHLNLLQGRLQADLSGFYMQIRNQQLSVMAGNYGFGRMMVNAGRSYSCGLEAQLRGRFADNRLDWALSYGYTRSIFKEYTDSVAAVAADGTSGYVLADYKDKRVPYVPEHTFSARADYRFDLGSTLRSITIGANVTGMGRTYWDNANLYCQKLYATLGAHAMLDFGSLQLNLWGRNLTDTRFNTFAVETGGRYFAQRGRPLSAGIDIRLSFK